MRKDLPHNVQIAQVIHAAGESGPAQSGTYAVALAVDSEAALLALHERLEFYQINHVLIREPDSPYNNSAMSIGIPPQPRGLLKRHLKGIKTCQP